MNKLREVLKQFIVYCANDFIDERDVSNQMVFTIDEFADYMLDKIDILSQKLQEVKHET